MWDHMHTYRKTQALCTPNAYHRLNISLQMPIRKTSYSHWGGKKMHLWFARKVCLTCPFIHSNYRDSTSGCQTFSGCFAKKLSVMEKGRTPPQQIISSCLFYYFHCFPTFRVTKKEKARREEEIPFGQHLFPCAGKELNGIGTMAVVGQVGSSVSYLYPSTYFGHALPNKLFPHLKVTVHDPTGTQCSQLPLFSKGNSWNPCWGFTEEVWK